MKCSFVILNYKTPHHLRLCLEHITELRLPFAHEIIVVDNASHDQSEEMMRARFPNVHLIVNEQNLGHPRGVNCGVAAATGEFVMIVNPDIIIRNSADIENMIHYMELHPDVGMCGPQLRNPDGSVQYSCYRRYSFWTPLYRRTFFGRFPMGQRDIARHLMTDVDHHQTMPVDWLLGAFLCVRRRMIADIGMMHEGFFLYFGDYEWCDRAWGAGWRVMYFHETQNIIHYHQRASAHGHHSLIQLISYVTRVHIRDWITYLQRKS